MAVYRTDRHQTFDSDGNLVSEQVEQVDITADVERDDAALRLRQSYQALRQFADDAAVVAAQGTNVTQAQHKALFDRFGKLCDGLADLLVHLRVNG